MCFLILSFLLRLGLPVGLLVKILKVLLRSSILARWPAHLNLLDLITLTILGGRTHYEVPNCGALSTPHFHPSWAQIFASGTWLNFPLPVFFP
jgi:hypothetical protein